MGKKQDQAGNQVYLRAYIFFEKKRILENKPKSKSRLKNEQQKQAQGGFDLHPPPTHGYFYGLPGEFM